MPGGLSCESSTSVSLIILSASSSVGFSPTFFHHVTLILCKHWCSLAVSTARLLSVGHRLDTATVVQLCEVVHHGGHFGVHFRVSLDSSSAIMSRSSRSWCGRLLLRYHVCRRTCLLSRHSAPSLCVTSPCGALIGPPTAFRRNGPSVQWVSLSGPTGVMTHPG